MAVNIRNCLGVDIGSQHIRVAHMEMGKSGPRVLGLYERELEIEANLNEAQRNLAIGRQVQELLKANKVRTRKAVFCVPGQTVFVRQFPLPKTTPERMRRMVNFEARQRVPFPLDKTIMEFQVFESESANEVNVLLVAIKRDFIMNFMRMVRRAGLSPIAISVSSVALYNFHELNTATRDLTQVLEKKAAQKAEKEKAKASGKKKDDKKKSGGLFGKKKNKNAPAEEQAPEPEEEEILEGLEDLEIESLGGELGFEEIQAYVNLGATLMDLAIPKPGPARMIGFTRSVPLAGNEMDRAVRDKLGFEALPQARAVKERDAVVLSTQFEMEGDPDKINQDASEAVTAVADRIIGELRRSLDYFISQPDGVAVDSIVLAGGLACMAHLSDYIEEKMGVPVTLSEMRNEQVRLPGAMPELFAPYAVATGLAFQGLGVAQNQIDFLPEDIKNIRGLQSRRWEALGMAAMLGVIVAMSYGVGQGRINRYRALISEYNTQINQTIQESNKVQAAKARHQKVYDAYSQLAGAAGNRAYWLDFSKKLMDRLPQSILIDEIDMRLDGNVIVRGKSKYIDSINEFMARLGELTKGQGAAVEGGPPADLPVQINSINPVQDRRFGTAEVQAFTVTIKTNPLVGRIRVIGDKPGPVPTPVPAAQTNTGFGFGNFGAGRR